MKRSVIALVSLLVLCAVGLSLAAPAAAQQQPDTTVITVSVDETGDATWNVSYRYGLETQEEQDAFDTLQTDIQNNRSTFEETFRQRLLASVSQAENQTDRNMSLHNTTVTTSREQFPQQATGVVTYSVTWTNFAGTEETDAGRTLRVGDAIRGFYVADDTRLTIRAPDSYRLADVTPSADSSTTDPARAVWEGPTSFTQDEPQFIATTIPADTGGGNNGDGVPTAFLAAGIAIGALLAIIILGALRPSIFPSGVWSTGEKEEEGSEDDGGEGEADGSDTTGDTSLMRNDERVLALLNENGGRMKQQAIVEKTGWSDAKTSNVVNELQDEGKVDKFQLGRENVVSLPDVEVDPTDDLDDK